MKTLELGHVPLPLRDPVLVVALDGWTDAGGGGSLALQALHDQFDTTPIGRFDPDALFDYRDRRPQLEIDQGALGDLHWPELVVRLVSPPTGPQLVTLAGAEPDLSWRGVADDVAELCRLLGVHRYVGLGSVPGPIPHTRPVHTIFTGTDEGLLEQLGRPHEQVVVPASCQVALEKMLADTGIDTLGMWVRIPHYVAGEYPQASRSLLEQLSGHLGIVLDTTVFDATIEENRVRLDVAGESSEEVLEHIRQLEQLYDAERHHGSGLSRGPSVVMSEENVPSGDELAAEIERFLRDR
ncbi:MAG: PAC2 family protein [Nitriliruptoraceae bacterium]